MTVGIANRRPRSSQSIAGGAPLIWNILTLGLAAVGLVACNATGPQLVSEPITEEITAQNVSTKCVNPTNHVLAIDGRGNYAPITFHEKRCAATFHASELYQPRPDMLTIDRCAPVEDVNRSGVLTPDQVNNYNALMCHIHRIIDDLINVPAGSPPNHLVIFIHGGLVSQHDALQRARRDIPAMIGSPLDPAFMRGGKVFPLFYIWPSGFFDSYADATLNYAQGEYGTPLRHVEAPLYFGTDLAETVAHAPLDLVKSIRRFADTFFGAGEEPAGWGCRLDLMHFGCNYRDINKLEFNALDSSVYIGTAPLRLVTVPALDTGTSAWKNMVARTRFGFTKYVDPAEYRQAFARRYPSEENNPQSQRNDSTDQDILTRGALYFLLRELSKVANTCDGLRITVIGHSMGAIVADEMMINFPDLPYQNIVFMAAAGNIRDFKAMTEPVLRAHKCEDLRFYNLSLHPEAEARDLEVSGAAPIGSLLEWIDDIFETPITPVDLTLGKWQNVVYAENEFDPIAARRMFFHRFGLRAPDPLMHGQFVLSASERPRGVCPGKSYWDPAFWSEVYSVKDGSCTNQRLYEIGRAQYGEPSE